MNRLPIVLCFISCLITVSHSFEVIDCDICHRRYVQGLSGTESTNIEDNTQRCHKNGRSFEQGEKYRHSHLRYQCDNGIMKIQGCYVDDSKDLGVDENFVDHDKNTAMKCYRKNGNIGFKEIFCGSVGFNEDFTGCKSTDTGNTVNTDCNICAENANLEKILTPKAQKPQKATLGSSADVSNLSANRCSKNGQFFTEGEIYKYNHLRYKCENGIMKVKGCYAPNDKDLEAGENFVDHENQSIMHCQKIGDKIGYKEVFCKATGFNEDNTECKGSNQNAEKTYDTISHHKVYVVKDEQGEKVDEEKVVHVNCECE